MSGGNSRQRRQFERAVARATGKTFPVTVPVKKRQDRQVDERPRLPAFIAEWGWVGLIGAGYGVEEGGEYLLGLLFLIGSSVSLAFAALKWKAQSRVFTYIARLLGFGLAFLLVGISVAWTWSVKDNNPWSRLLPRHDYRAFVHGGIINQTATPYLFAKHRETELQVTPVAVALYIGIENLQSNAARIVDLQLSLVGSNGTEIRLTQIPDDFIYYSPFGFRVDFPGERSMSDVLRGAAISGMDSVDGLILCDAPDSISNLTKPLRLKITVKDLSGRPQSTLGIDGVEGNLRPDYLKMHIMTTPPEDVKKWRVVHYADDPF